MARFEQRITDEQVAAALEEDRGWYFASVRCG
jgi:hypothetical protein